MSITLNGSATSIPNGVRLTPDSATNNAGSFFLNDKQPYSSFTIDFDYLATSINTSADGFTVVLHNDSRGVNALGSPGGSLGYGGIFGNKITPSISFQTKFFGNIVNGVAYATNGNITFPRETPSNIILSNHAPIHYNITYNGTILKTTMTQPGANTFVLSQDIDLSLILGDYPLAFVGFTGSTGGNTSQQDITNFVFRVGVPCLHKSTLVTVLPSLDAKKTEEKSISNIRAGDLVYNHKGKVVNVLHNIRFAKTDSFIKIEKGSLGPNMPSDDLLIRDRHPILVNGKIVEPRRLLGKNDKVTKVLLDKSEVYSLCTQEKMFVMMQGVPVKTWSYSDLIKSKFHYELI